jgi:hypothetical protein
MKNKKYYWIVYRDSDNILKSVSVDIEKDAKKAISESSSFLIAWKISYTENEKFLEVYDCSDKNRVGEKYISNI